MNCIMGSVRLCYAFTIVYELKMHSRVVATIRKSAGFQQPTANCSEIEPGFFFFPDGDSRTLKAIALTSR